MENNESLVVNMFRDSPWPGNMLSNFANTPFVFDGIQCSCSEAVIQSLKVSNKVDQNRFCSLQGQEAWERGSRLTDSIFESGKVWWLGKSYGLHSIEHFSLVKRALVEKYSQSIEAREALLATGEAKLVHNYGQKPGKKQSLPVNIFCDIVVEIRSDLRSK